MFSEGMIYGPKEYTEFQENWIAFIDHTDAEGNTSVAATVMGETEEILRQRADVILEGLAELE